MAWEMHHRMFGHIGPSIATYIEENFQNDDERRNWLLERLEENDADVYADSSLDHLIDCLCDCAIEIATTDSGGFEFWVEPEGCSTIPWCSEDDMLAYHG